MSDFSPWLSHLCINLALWAFPLKNCHTSPLTSIPFSNISVLFATILPILFRQDSKSDIDFDLDDDSVDNDGLKNDEADNA